MNTTWTKQDLLDQFGRVATILHHGLAFIGLAAVVLVLARGKTLFSDEHASPAAAVGSIRYDGAVSLLDGADDTDTQKYRALANYVSRRYRIAPDVTEQFAGAAYAAGREAGLDPLLILAVMADASRPPSIRAILSTPSLRSSSERVYAKRTWRSGRFEPKSSPGVIATPASSSTRNANRVLSSERLSHPA